MKKNYIYYILFALVLFGLGYYTGVKVQPKVDQLKSNYHKVVDGVFSDTTSVKDSVSLIKDSVLLQVKQPMVYEVCDENPIDTFYTNKYHAVFLLNTHDSICTVTGYTNDSSKFAFTINGATPEILSNQSITNQILEYAITLEGSDTGDLEIVLVPGKHYKCSH